MKLDKNEIIVKNQKGEEFILNTVTKQMRIIPIEKEQINKQEEFNFCDMVMKIAKNEFEAGKHQSLSAAIESVVKDCPELYEHYSRKNTKIVRSD